MPAPVFDELDDVQSALGNLEKHEPPLVTALPRQPGQKEGRHAHLLCGEPEVLQVAVQAPAPGKPSVERSENIESRIEALESELKAVKGRLRAPEESSGQ